MAVLTAEGSLRAQHMQVADVSKPLQSVRAMMAAKHAVVFDEEGCFAINKVTGECNKIVDDGVNFKMVQYVVPPGEVAALMEMMGESAGFTRQE